MPPQGAAPGILSGVAEITEAGQAPKTFKAGDCFVMQPGYTGT